MRNYPWPGTGRVGGRAAEGGRSGADSCAQRLTCFLPLAGQGLLFTAGVLDFTANMGGSTLALKPSTAPTSHRTVLPGGIALFTSQLQGLHALRG